MNDSRDVTLGDRTFVVPALPPIVNRIVFPLCRQLDPLVKRTLESGGEFNPTREEYDALLECIFEAIQFGTPDLTKEAFMLQVAAPQEHYQALLVVRLQTGGWTLAKPEDGEGEATGTA